MKKVSSQFNRISFQKPVGRGPFAIHLLEPNQADTVLNVGCFDGALEYFFLTGKVKAFYGIDLNQDAIACAQAWEPKSFQVAPSEKIPFPDHFFTKILCLDTFEHVENELATASEMYRVLKPGGILILSVPNNFLNFLDPDFLTRGVRNFVRKYIKRKPLLTHPEHRHYSLKDLQHFFPSFEMRHVHISGTPIFWILTMLYTAFGLPQGLVKWMSKLTAPIENWDYRMRLPIGFNIMVQMKKR